MEWGEFQWTRIAAFFGGLGVAIFLVWITPSQYLPRHIAATLVSLPVGLCFYGVTERSFRGTARIAVGVGIGIGLGTYLGTAGVALAG